eukprot:5689269-Pyramimonas_sp.AAC.1
MEGRLRSINTPMATVRTMDIQPARWIRTDESRTKAEAERPKGRAINRFVRWSTIMKSIIELLMVHNDLILKCRVGHGPISRPRALEASGA